MFRLNRFFYPFNVCNPMQSLEKRRTVWVLMFLKQKYSLSLSSIIKGYQYTSVYSLKVNMNLPSYMYIDIDKTRDATVTIIHRLPVLNGNRSTGNWYQPETASPETDTNRKPFHRQPVQTGENPYSV